MVSYASNALISSDWKRSILCSNYDTLLGANCTSFSIDICMSQSLNAAFFCPV